MPKRILSAADAFDLRQSLHVATLDALMASRRWAPGDLVFQGGTSLHLSNGSPRFSEDLDFLVDSSLKFSSIGRAMQARLDNTGWLPAGTNLTVGTAKDGHNPHSFVVTLGGPDVIGAVRVEVKLWQTSNQFLSGLRALVAPVKFARGPAAGIQAFVTTAELPEIYADKVFAIAARRYLKPRDVFDLHWLHSRGLQECTTDELRARLATYPNETPEGWLEKAFQRRQELQVAQEPIATDLKRWLPSSWPMGPADTTAMAQHSVEALEQGIDMMREIQASMSDDYESPAP